MQHQQLQQSQSSDQSLPVVLPSDESYINEGVMSFPKWISKSEIRHLMLHQMTHKLFQKRTWELEHGKYNLVNETFILAIVYQVRIQRLALFKNKRPNIIREIKQIRFPILKKLILDDNHINSLEFLDQVQGPLLQSLALVNNRITHFKTFKKTNFPNLFYINLDKNFIKDVKEIALMQTQNFDQLYIQTDNKIKTKVENIDWVPKITSKTFQQIWVQSSNINLKRQKQMLFKKFSELQFQQITQRK